MSSAIHRWWQSAGGQERHESLGEAGNERARAGAKPHTAHTPPRKPPRRELRVVVAGG